MTTTISYASIHSLTRAKERAGLNERKAERQISRAMRDGKPADAFSSWERSYLEKEAYGDCTAIAYSGFCYIVNSNGFCVTMYPLPAWFGKKKHFDGKERIRNVKTYAKHHANNYDYYECC